MIKIKRSSDRGISKLGWLTSYHTFSFANYKDPAFSSISALRVINEATIAAGAGFPVYSHRDTEILTYVISGSILHKNSLGYSTVLNTGQMQKMTAGSGVKYSDLNHLQKDATQILQIWILPDQNNHQPSYQHIDLSEKTMQQDFALIASNHNLENIIQLNQDVEIFVHKSEAAAEKFFNADQSRVYWVQMIKGVMTLNDQFTLAAGDGAAISAMNRIHLKWQKNSEFIFLDLP